jgi:hypothetical protein
MGHECQNIPGGVPSQGGTPPRNFPSSTVWFVWFFRPQTPSDLKTHI